jgi:[acyl-carrier-protein] S-malonyltransferase
MIAALFPGQNSHEVGMGTVFADQFAVAKAVFDTAEQTLPGLTGLMRDGPLETLTLTANQQPALVTASIAAFRVWQAQTGLVPAYAAGHSLGEFSAHVAAGSLELATAISLVHQRGTFMQEAVAPGVGAMAAIMGDSKVVVDTLEGGNFGIVEAANFNAPTQTVISGEKEAVAAAGVALKALGCKVIPLKVSAPFHCSLMQPAREKLTVALEGISFSNPTFPIIANVTADVVDSAAPIADLLSRQVTASVRWVETIYKLRDLGVTEFIEFGSGTVLTGLIKRILPDAVTVNYRV